MIRYNVTDKVRLKDNTKAKPELNIGEDDVAEVVDEHTSSSGDQIIWLKYPHLDKFYIFFPEDVKRE